MVKKNASGSIGGEHPRCERVMLIYDDCAKRRKVASVSIYQQKAPSEKYSTGLCAVNSRVHKVSMAANEKSLCVRRAC
jgi:hypothetical protein